MDESRMMSEVNNLRETSTHGPKEKKMRESHEKSPLKIMGMEKSVGGNVDQEKN